MKKPNPQIKYNSTNQRLLWPDIIRIIAIYFVIQIHTSIQAINTNTSTMPLGKLAIMGVPLFVILSGALLLEKTEDYIVFFRKRCMKVLIPWIIWTFLYMAYYLNFDHTQITDVYFSNNSSMIFKWFHYFFVTFMSNLWFLPMIFSIYLLTPLLRIIVKHAIFKDKLYFIFLWLIGIVILPYFLNSPLFPIWEPNIVYTAIQYSGYFFLGNIISKLNYIDGKRLSVIFLFFISPFVISLLPINSYIFKNFTSGYLYPGTAIASVAFFYLLLSVSNNLDKYVSPFMKKVISVSSGASFGVYIINDMFLNYFRNELIKIPTIFHTEVLLTIITFIILTFVVIILQKIPLLKYIFP